MASGGVDPLVRYLVLGGLAYVGWNWAKAQPAGSWARKMVDDLGATPAQAASSGGGGGGGGSPPAGTRATSSPAPAPGGGGGSASVNTDNTPVNQYNQEQDGNWYQITQWSDGTYTSWQIPPSMWADYGIPTGGAGATYGPPVESGPCVVQKHDDGAWYNDCPFSDGTWSYTLIDPSEYVLWGILPDGSATNPYPVVGI
jgi:hypothetical protein